MEVKEALLKRRSIRKFTDEKVSDEIIEELMKAAMSAPSACNKLPWEFFAITNEEILNEMRHASRFTGYNAPLMIVVCGNLENALPREMAEYWVQDCSAATENILLRAVELGLGSVWCGIYPQEIPQKRVKEMLSLPDNFIPLNVINIGYPAESHRERTQYDPEKVHYVK